jgi:DNA-binding LytR/AlgR family response regulator
MGDRLLVPRVNFVTSFWEAQLITLQVGVFPVAFIVFRKQMVLYRRYIAEAKTVNEDIHQPGEAKPVEAPAEELIRLQGEGQKEELVLHPQHLFFIASADNYVRVQYGKEGRPESVLIRSTLKKMEEQLAAHPYFFRCHRMYLVNLQLVDRVSGNAQGLRLHLQGSEEPIPVSRSLTQTVKDRLHSLSHSPQQP